MTKEKDTTYISFVYCDVRGVAPSSRAFLTKEEKDRLIDILSNEVAVEDGVKLILFAKHKKPHIMIGKRTEK